MAKIKPLRFDYSGALIPGGITQEQLESLAPRLEQARRTMLDEDLPQFESGDVPDDKQPLDAGFHELPDRILAEYNADRSNSELSQILRAAHRMAERVDRVVVLGIGGSYMGARALLEGCCQPYFNELSRGERAGRPRIYFEGNNVDNDWSQALLHLLQNSHDKSPWGIVVISKSGGTLETAVAFRQFLRALQDQVGDEALPDLVIPVTGESGKLSRLADQIGCRDRFLVPDGVGGRFSIFSAVGLLPAALLGIDVVTLLEAAAWMNDHFRNAAWPDNLVMNHVGVNHLLEYQCGCLTRVLSAWSKSLESVGFWYDQLLAESLGKNEMGALPLTVVNTRDLHSRAQQHQEGRRDKVMNNLVVEGWRFDPLPVGQIPWNDDELNDLADRTLPDIMNAAVRGTNLAYQGDHRPTTDLYLPAVDENSLGQFFQMMMLATVLEGRLLGINPYGQPGVEQYKKNMNRLLREA